MERTTWTDERLDDMSRRMDAGFARVDADIREVKQELGSVRTDLGAEINALRTTMMLVGGGVMTGLVGVIATLLAQG